MLTFPGGKAGIFLPGICLIGFLLLFNTDSLQAQIALRGMVVDSLTMEVLPNVNITIMNKGVGTVSDIQGLFQIEAGESDTISFSRVGYLTKMLRANVLKEMVVVFLKEERRMLDPVEVRDQKPSWLPDLPEESRWKNQTFNQSFRETQGFQGIQTFGPGFIFRMPGAGFKREARAREKLRKAQIENDQAKDYIHLVNSAEIKGRLMKDYNLSEDEFYRLLAVFNERNGAFIHKLEEHEVIPVLIQFFADEAGNKKK